jgi:hypothetical protein
LPSAPGKQDLGNLNHRRIWYGGRLVNPGCHILHADTKAAGELAMAHQGDDFPHDALFIFALRHWADFRLNYKLRPYQVFPAANDPDYWKAGRRKGARLGEKEAGFMRGWCDRVCREVDLNA